ncbi:MAG TPA: hypothetical protein VK464_14075 [Symbiobacteriaceae bacterium]|nr:hypothetical protein [Symbiobacteriaceae bacterium]
MAKRTYAVTHSQAPDPDPRRVAAALERWQEGLAEAVIKNRERPIATIMVGPGRVIRKARRAAGK